MSKDKFEFINQYENYKNREDGHSNSLERKLKNDRRSN